MKSKYNVNVGDSGGGMQQISPRITTTNQQSPRYNQIQPSPKHCRSPAMVQQQHSNRIAQSMPTTPRRSSGGAIQYHLQKQTMTPGYIMQQRRISLTSPPVGGKISPASVQPQRMQQQQSKRPRTGSSSTIVGQNVQGVAGQMAGRRPMSMMNVNQSPIPSSTGSIHGQSITSPKTPMKSHGGSYNMQGVSRTKGSGEGGGMMTPPVWKQQQMSTPINASPSSNLYGVAMSPGFGLSGFR